MTYSGYLPFFRHLRFWGVHLAALVGILCFGWTTQAVLCCILLYIVRMFGVTAGYHRYFSHRSFKTTRVFAFLLALLAQSSGQRGVIWWARNHRHHHRFSDCPEDLHSPKQNGFWHAHIGWIFHNDAYRSQNNVSDLERGWELRFLDRFPMLPAIILGFFCWYFFDWQGLFAGFFLSTVLLFHGTFTINSLAHVWGSRRYETKDTSRNNLFLALLTLGEGWHNNHHHYMRSAQQGFFWWEIDPTYYMLKVLSWMNIVWDLRVAPEHVRNPRSVQKRA
jgi:stearoyl-CoA desaturase (delta-9 desaturase)